MREEILENALSLAKAGFTVFKIKGKIPAVRWRNHPFTKPAGIEDYFGNWNHNFGVAPNRNQLVIDIDPRNFNDDDEPHKRLFNDVGIDLKNCKTPIVKTGGGGFHIYFQVKDIPDKEKIRKNHKNYKGIDFITDGAYVVGPGSIHPGTNKEYTVMKGHDFSAVAFAPQKLLDLLLKEVVKKPIDDTKSIKDDDEIILGRYRTYLEAAPAAEEGDSGDLRTYKVACAGRDFALSQSMTLEMMIKFYNQRCEPPWSVEELQVKVENAFEYANGGRGSRLTESDFDVIKKDELDRNVRWDMSGGTYKGTLNNAINQFKPLELFGYGENRLAKGLAYNTFSDKITKIKWMPWDSPNGKKIPKYGVEWTDTDTARLQVFLSVKRNFNAQDSIIHKAIIDTACKTEIHPVRDYIRSLHWDGVERLETWLINISDAKNNKMNRAISKITIMQAVARVLYPGCQCDYITVLEGDQGIRKTTLVRILGGEWYAEINIDPSSKDTVDGMRGKWFIEMAEMEVTRKDDARALKAFITRSTDRYRPAYARNPVDVPRQSCFIGTFNPDALGQYLNDPTGARRFLPIELGEKLLKTSDIAMIRGQLFAEAYDRIIKGEEWYITDPDVLADLKRAQRKRQMSDGWSIVIEDYIAKENLEHFTGVDIFTDALFAPIAQYRFHEQRRISNCLRELGFIKTTFRNDNGKMVSGFLNPKYKPNKVKEDLHE